MKARRVCAVLALAVLLSGCSKPPPAEEPLPEPEKPVVKETYQDIEEIFSDVCEGASVKVWTSPTRLEVHILTEEMSSRNPPDTWDATVEALGNALVAGMDAAKKYGSAILTAQIEDARGTIYASGYNGTVRFDYPNKLENLRPKEGEFPLSIESFSFVPEYEPDYAVTFTGDGIYITETGSHYHRDPSCNQGKYFPATLEEAKARGLTPCGKCIG